VSDASGVEVVRAVSLGDVPHGFLGRRGGVSTGVVAGLNVGSGSNDDRDAIARNKALAIAAILPGTRLATVHQVHSAEAVAVEQPWPMDERPHADAMVTDRPGILLGVVTAD
jgi:copper oxidase (laccase) domain-containing protein